MPIDFWFQSQWGVASSVYSATLTFGGLTLALGWVAFGRVHDTLLRPRIGQYLMRAELIEDYFVHIDFMHTFQIISIIMSALGIFSVVADFPMFVDRSILALVIASTAYALKQATDSVIMMNDLVWQVAYFESQDTENSPNLQAIKGGREAK